MTTTNELTIVHVIRHRELALEPNFGIVSCELARRRTADVALLVFDLRTRLSDKAVSDADLVRRDHHLETLPRAGGRDFAGHLGGLAQPAEDALLVALFPGLLILVVAKAIQVVDQGV